MKIAIDATDSFWPQATGTVVYVRELVRYLIDAEHGHDWTILGRRTHGVDTGFAPPDKLKLLRSPKSRAVWTQLRLPLHVWRGGYDLLHMPSPKLPMLLSCRSVVTVHDLAMLRSPNAFEPFQRDRLTLYLRQAVKRATHLIAVSHATKRDLIELSHVPEKKIDVVHLGVDHSRFSAGATAVAPKVPYILAVGTLQPRKNYLMLIQAFNRLCETKCEPVELHIVGQRGWMYESIAQAAARSPFADRIRLLGYIPDEALPSLYLGATVFAFPSLYEGFGIPLLEAMAAGTPVVASNVSSIPEVVGDAAVLLDPNDVELWARTLGELLADPTRCRQLRAKGQDRARQFDWRTTAKQTRRVYERVLGVQCTE